MIPLRRNPHPMVALAMGLCLVAPACGAVVSRGDLPPTTRASYERSGYGGRIDPGDFVRRIDNPYFPLRPGTTFRLRGANEGGRVKEVITVTRRHKVILGVRMTVVRDVGYVNGKLDEFTYDWYAQDRRGNVWYFGEDTAQYENGKVVSTDGSWEAGVDGARAGILMPGGPEVSDAGRQEFYKGEAEGMFWVVATGESKRVPLGRFDKVVRVLEWSPLEPKIVIEKHYAPGVGLLSERALSGETELVELVRMTRR